MLKSRYVSDLYGTFLRSNYSTYRSAVNGERMGVKRQKTSNSGSPDAGELSGVATVNIGSEKSDTPAQQRLQEDSVSDFSEGEESIDETLYFPTINRKRLDFDFEKICSVSLSNVNVYACLTCGKYFQGRGKSSYAYLHSIDADSHRMYINLQTLKVYVLPDSYEIHSNALDDIKYVIRPNYSKEDVANLNKEPHVCYDLDRNPYNQGYIGLNNLKANDYANCVIQALSHVSPLRDYLLLVDHSDLTDKAPLAGFMSILIKKLWNPKAFRAHVSPHELLQYISVASANRFVPVKSSDPFSFMNYLLNNLHLALGGSRSKHKSKSSIVQRVFQGRMRVILQSIRTATREDRVLTFDVASEAQIQETPFLFLSLDLPPAPLFKNDSDQESIPQIALTQLLAKYNGVTTHELPGQVRRYQLLEAPEYLIFNIKRIESNAGIAEEPAVNPTVVSFSPNELDISPYIDGSVGRSERTTYDLTANIVRVQSGDKRRYAVQIYDPTRNGWFKFEDLHVEPIRREFLFLDESYIQIWRRRGGE